MTYNDLYIDGKWMPGAGGRRFDVVNPATEDVLATVASADIADANRALDSACRAMMVWKEKPPRERAEVLRRAWELMNSRLSDFARLITLENGKAEQDAMGEAVYAAEFFRWFAEEAVRIEGSLSRAPSSGARILVDHRPAGISVLVTPWNYPAAMATRKIAPALAAGCAVILKPAAETPLTMLALMPLLEEAGVPNGLVNVLPTDSPGPLVEHLLNDPRVRVVSFTGSTDVGKLLLRSASHQVLKPAMELGGNAPFIVFEDASVDDAVNGAMQAKMRNIGEACTAANRFFVHENVATEFTAKFSERMASLKVGNGLQPESDVGPLVNAATRDKVAHLVKDAVAKGAKIETGGKALDGPGYFYPPTVLSNVSADATCNAEEIFGPVAAIQTFTDEDAVIKSANETEYGLVAYVYTGDMQRGLRVSEFLEFGMIGLNRGLVSDPAAPFGGMKQSGLGREGRREGIQEFMETQYISTEW
ncbi:NAD-dependent succinate-semialdehyde dehydrogenase [Roseovarius aestuarii]|nr:NAD-dependent succinate-semialdehyde dehydrogenase [Roseovarius aestuarii]